MITMPSEKRISRAETGTEDKGNWELYYTNIVREVFGDGYPFELEGHAEFENWGPITENCFTSAWQPVSCGGAIF